ncbi:hypothetical protein Tco_0553214 [Tanacetum coccineum]
MSLPHFQKGHAEVMETMSFFGSFGIWPAADLCIGVVAQTSSGRIPCSIYTWIGVIQVLVASSSIALTSTVSTDRSLSSSIRAPFVIPSHYTAASLLRASSLLLSSLASCSSLLFPSARVSLSPLAFICVELSSAIVSAKKSASTCRFIALLEAYLMP